ncbi:hypothetical protein Leryth_006351 [Lithospermum erythrorhizon]|nr:hypothetical protein Leryth_006351 [Lithospermum erythrorhizon]
MEENNIDPDISRWILEFLLHQNIEYHILDSIASVLPISDNNFLLSKLFLLRKLQHELSNCILSEKLLDFLDEIYQVDQCLGSKDCLESLKKVYCAVCVEFTVGFLRKCGNNVKGGFFDVVKRLWRGRVREMEKKNIGLVSEELLEWKNDIEAAVWEESVCLRVVERSKDVDAVELVKLYVKEEKTRMGPSFLELVSKTLKAEEGEVSGAVRSRKRGESGQFRRNDGQEQQFDNDGNSCDKGENVLVDTEKRGSLERCKHGAHKRSRIGTSGSSSGAKVADVEHDLNAGKSCNEQLGTLEVEKVQEALESSRLGVPGIEEDPLPGGQNRCKTSEGNAKNSQTNAPGEENRANVGVESTDYEPPEEENRAKSSGVDNVVNVQSGEAKQNCPDQSNAPKNLMEQKKTACTSEWDDSIDNSSAEPFDSSGRSNRHSSRRRRVSPLNIYKEPKVKQPRKKKMWSDVEEDTLRAGVTKFGHGYWKVILNEHLDIFQGRTEVDLKDKWRNMTRQRK